MLNKDGNCVKLTHSNSKNGADTSHGSHTIPPTCQEKHFQTATCHIQSPPLREHARRSQDSHWPAPTFTVPDMTPSVVCKPRDTRTVDFAQIAWCLSPNLKVVSASKGSVSSKIPPQVTTHTIPAHVTCTCVHVMHGTPPVRCIGTLAKS